jgi:dTDP-4-dehydrorhamnose reductase
VAAAGNLAALADTALIRGTGAEMRVMVTGAGGQLGQELARTCPENISLYALPHALCDIRSAESVLSATRAIRPRVIINAAAYNAVDNAETDHEGAFAGNATGPANLAAAAGEIGARLIHVSTDYVFDGEKRSPYDPRDATNPINVYGASKLEGEKRVAGILPDALSIRTSWLYSSSGSSFVLRMLSLLREKGSLRMVSDQISVPTSARGLARFIWRCVPESPATGVVHWVDAGEGSRYDQTLAIYEIARQRGLLPAGYSVVPISAEEYAAPAPRPAYSVLDARAMWDASGITPGDWRAVLSDVMMEL